MSNLAKIAATWPDASQYLIGAFRYKWFETQLERAYRERPILTSFSRESHEHTISRFRELDNLSIEYNRATLAHIHWNKLPAHDAGGQLGILRREFVKKSRHMHIRQLMINAGNAVQAIKPVFMMSPQSVASFLPRGSLKFDLIIFDEASQVKPVDAFGALLRGTQAVVVGDEKQLPPTNFFDSLTQADESDEDDVTGDMESILGLFVAQGAPERMLKWHYRSRHESLIAISNYEFYGNRLIVFPSPVADREEMGLVYQYLPNTSYDRGKSRTNVEEAKTVANAVMSHAQLHPNLTLGVAAFSVAQMQAIMDQLEILRRQDPSCESFFTGNQHEPFFVKNLENVQGDERDVILISIGYGRTADGYIAMDFGPLNRQGGERRLNVLITRARRRCEVFTNLTADDIDLNRSDARGVRALKTFLSYAQNGKLDVPIATGREPDSPFEEEVISALTDLGYQVHPQVGSAGFFIDIAVVDPKQPGRYLVGIECDGATYHSARSARDRDRLRQQVLENLGWRIHRIWSTDWFRDAQRELKRVVTAIEEAKVSVPAVHREKESAPSKQITQMERDSKSSETAKSLSLPEYKMAKPSVRTYGSLRSSWSFELHTMEDLASWVAEVVQVESPVHISEVARRIADAAGIGRIGSRIQAAIDRSCNYAIHIGIINEKDNFLWSPDMKRPVPRDRSGLPTSSRKLELVAPEEIAEVVIKLVAGSYGIGSEDIPPAVCRLLGFGRASDDMRHRVNSVIAVMIKDGRLSEQGNHLVIPSTGV